jgi:NAD+ synthase
MEKLVKDIKNWIYEYCNSNNIQSLVVGVSGGIDSAVVSKICALTGIKTYCVILPINQNINETIRAENHISNLINSHNNVELVKIEMSETFLSFKITIPEKFNSELGFANSKSRLRMITLYQISQSTNGIVVGTGNKIEDFGIGFFTKYGDGGVDISPIADLYKSEVYSIGEYLGVSSEILLSPPTDGLWEDGRTDMTQIGVDYSDLEWAMKYVESGDVKEISEKEKIILDLYTNLNYKNKHKMVNIPTFKK